MCFLSRPCGKQILDQHVSGQPQALQHVWKPGLGAQLLLFSLQASTQRVQKCQNKHVELGFESIHFTHMHCFVNMSETCRAQKD
jgi:hypothetical protein